MLLSALPSPRGSSTAKPSAPRASRDPGSVWGQWRVEHPKWRLDHQHRHWFTLLISPYLKIVKHGEFSMINLKINIVNNGDVTWFDQLKHPTWWLITSTQRWSFIIRIEPTNMGGFAAWKKSSVPIMNTGTETIRACGSHQETILYRYHLYCPKKLESQKSIIQEGFNDQSLHEYQQQKYTNIMGHTGMQPTSWRGVHFKRVANKWIIIGMKQNTWEKKTIMT